MNEYIVMPARLCHEIDTAHGYDGSFHPGLISGYFMLTCCMLF
jgi:hypothetical protein